MAEQNWLALGATGLFLGWCLLTVLPGSRKPEDQDDDTDDTDDVYLRVELGLALALAGRR